MGLENERSDRQFDEIVGRCDGMVEGRLIFRNGKTGKVETKAILEYTECRHVSCSANNSKTE